MTDSADPLLVFYGDDFTGSTDVMEVMSVNGLPAVLFLGQPSTEDLQTFAGYRAFGVAGISRAEPPDWMDENLPPVFESLRSLNAPLCHYKTCSTFDSSPSVGNIGRALELGQSVFGNRAVPMVIGAPALKRYVLFGNLFATVGNETFRLDRHPTMSQHPVTPMDESDVQRHIGKQTSLVSGLVDILALQSEQGLSQFYELVQQGKSMIFFDTLDDQSLCEAGRVIWETRAENPFVVGSSGVEYALMAWWRSQGLLSEKPKLMEPGPVDQLLVISGSCSPVSGNQIQWAVANGFEGIPIDPVRLLSDSGEFDQVLTRTRQLLSEGKSPIAYTSTGVSLSETGDVNFGRKIGERLSDLAVEVFCQTKLKRVVVAGGDTSGRVGHALNIQALTMVYPFASGSPLCKAWAPGRPIDQVEIMLKGGQVGEVDLYGQIRAGSRKV